MPQSREDAWTGSWVTDKLKNHNKIAEVFTISSNRVKVQRTSGDEYEIATIASSHVNESNLLDILALERGVSFVTNISKDAYYHGRAINLAESENIVLGNLGDLFRAMRLENPRTYVNPEVRFILRGIKQHNRVSNVFRLDDRRYQIERVGLVRFIVLALHDYDLSADCIRDGLEKYGYCDAILSANPNCILTKLAETAAKSAGIPVYKWAELLGALNKP